MAWCHQANKAITWANVDPDLCGHMASLGHNEFSTELIEDEDQLQGPISLTFLPV